MNLTDIQLPRELEADGSAENIRKVLAARTIQLWSGGKLSIPMITMSESLKKVLQRAILNGRIRWGLEAISGKLEEEEKGIAKLRESRGFQTGERISRLLLVSNDGAERFYRHIEQLLNAYAPRLFACMLDMDSSNFGSLISGREKQIKVIMAEHKSVVTHILQAISIG